MNCAAEIIILLCSLNLAHFVLCQRQPTDITRADGESNVFIPCPFEFRETPSIWRIGGVDYTAATIPSIYYSITPVGLFINTVHVCMNQTSFQCIDTSDNALEEQLSDVGILTVTSMDNCTDDEFDMLFREEIPQLEVNHKLTQYGSRNTTLAWKMAPVEDDCTTTRILSFQRCEQNNVITNDTTEDKMITLLSGSFQQSGELVDFNVSSLSSQSLEECPSLMDTLRFNVNKTEIINLLHGKNNCTCIELERRGGLSFAFSNPNPDEVDIVCRISGTGCYSPVKCNRFSESGLTPFFYLCDNPPSENSHTMTFGNISEQLNGTRLELFALKAARCPLTPSYAAREYFRSFELNVMNASASISVNITSREICFTSLDNCSHTDSTRYSVFIVDISGNTLFGEDNIPESTCQVVSQLELLPQCGPFQISTQPINEYIVYNPDFQQITSDRQPSELCSCLKATIQLEITTIYNPQTSEIEVSYQCWAIYTTPVHVTFIYDENGSSTVQSTMSCSNGTYKSMTDSNHCNYELRVCSNFTFTSGTVLTDCILKCSDPIMIPCPTTPTMGPSPPDPGSGSLSIGAIIGIVLGVVVVLGCGAAVAVGVIILLYKYRSDPRIIQAPINQGIDNRNIEIDVLAPRYPNDIDNPLSEFAPVNADT